MTIPHKQIQRGFTIIELVVVIVILGIMAVVVLPRMDSLGGFEAAGFRDQTVAILRFAQKSALAQRRAVCVSVGATGVTLTIDTTTPPNDSCDAALVPPFTPRAGSGLAGSGFSFLRMGQTNQGSDITLTIAGADPVRIDAVTGYVR
ncbi:prepilin-type N-terminal cleavage/methylation domain-containing protein [Sulfuritalea hydrogenivorans]|jgi:MSHA pilin protein MshC|uniref:Uncharacterized protein n=1 Tax=Sulfuritalea hydrogenivorans sk43H TaxID=1223802 RepID=W0SCH9_9PROT|nr:prepilin-type N-terminal cleavage/methylation domain-containing protein [Sulfuritalea hydrogenivorans]MDK9715938.1 prepilin-type N-terminal cleavage/methylation domain-containing protein [Sulfuritalea sp.]BAO28637.1 hypothetical protein SUTH_00829 [Sulfuritalea hydrogenivorans sk43H]